MSGDFEVARSRAVEPLFYRPPSPSILPNGMKVMAFQEAGAEYVLSRKHALIGDQPGLTKSAQSVIVGNAIEAQHTLVVAPASLRLNWEREIWAWSTIPNVRTYPVLKANDGISTSAHYVIVSWALLSNPHILAALMAERWDHLILDEAHAIKDPHGNKRTQVVCAPDLLPRVCGRITALTGTPAPNQPIELYNLIRLLNWEAINRASLEDFRNFYYDLGEGWVRGRVFDEKLQAWVNKVHWSKAVRNVPRHLADLQFRLRKWVMVRRLKEDVLHELPAKTWHPFPLAMTGDIKRALQHPGWKKASKLYDMDPTAFHESIVDGEISTARKELGVAKAPSVASYIEELLDGSAEKVVVAAWHHDVLRILRERLAQYGLVYMDGSSSPKAKQRAVDEFQNNSRVRIILGQMLPLGEGWTLTAAQDAVFGEFDWVPGKNDQFLDRICRMGQKGNYIIGHVPVVPGTLDERILSTAIAKDLHLYQTLDKPLDAA